MKLTQTLLGYLHRVFNKDPAQFLALRLQYAGGLTWQVADGVLTTVVTGGVGQNLSVDLSQYTLSGLALYLAGQAGYEIVYVDETGLSVQSSLILIDGSNDISLSNGDHLYGYTSVLWSYLEAASSELEEAQTQIGNMLLQMSTTTGSGEWLDVIGSYYGVPRLSGELDPSYGPRIIAEVLRPRGNNVAIEAAINAYTGQAVTVTDVVLYTPQFPLYDGAILRDGSHVYGTTGKPIYGLFDVTYGYDLINGGDISTFEQTITDLINRLRDAGTHLRALVLSGSMLADSLVAPTDTGFSLAIGALFADDLTAPTDGLVFDASSIAPFSDALTAPADDESLTIVYGYTYGGLRSYNSVILHMGGKTVTESI